VINKAAQNGMVVLLAPLYLGFGCGGEGWCGEVRASSLAAMRSYGRYVGNRYKNTPNIIWLIGGDTDPVANGVEGKVREFVAGIKDYDTVHLMTAHNGPEQSAMAGWGNEPWLNLNDVYTYQATYVASLQEYNRQPSKNWVIFGQYDSAATGDLWFEPWGTPGFHVKVWYSDETTEEVDAP
jgi:hypothetical protein